THVVVERKRTTLRAIVLSLLRFKSLSMKDRQLLLDEASAQITFRAHDMPEFLQIFFDRPADDGVAIIAPQFHFARGGDETRVDLLGRFRSALDQTAGDVVELGRHNKNIGQRLANE